MTADIQPTPRQLLPADFQVTDWPTLEPYFKELSERTISSLQELEQWLKDLSELEAVISEDACWRQIKMTCDTENPQLAESFNYFMMEIQPKIQPYSDLLNRKLVDHPFTKELKEPAYFTYLRNVKKNIDLFREENIPLQSELAVEAQQFGVISGKMAIEVGGKEYTLQQAAKFLEDPDRSVREEVYRKIAERRLQDKDALNELYDGLLKKRNQVALNAGFENYRDYRFAELGRFDYTKGDSFQFQEAVKQYVLPIVDEIYKKKQAKLSLDSLRPWDTDAEPAGVEPLKPFKTGGDLLQKTVTCFEALNPFFAACLEKMSQLKRFDLESRKGKAPGGYNCPLAETGAPFIFMNAAGTLNDVITMVHEGGHAIHSFLSHPLPLTGFKEYPTEFAEVASMSMELFSMNEWGVFFEKEEELRRAKELQLERVLTIFPWIATIDKFQHWVYENPNHTREERLQNWQRILTEFTPASLDVTGLEAYRNYSWQRQLHLFEVPFYYIEYGIAQLGAIGLWQQFQKNKEQALKNYTHALSLGGTRTLPQLFEAAGLQFDLSPAHIKGLMEFVKEEMEKV
ncbi:MAG TPA: M3 family oligoendopeptidase [Niabella sp.]|nr:M3 family oligoendopeptidase [Niabella sp.]